MMNQAVEAAGTAQVNQARVDQTRSIAGDPQERKMETGKMPGKGTISRLEIKIRSRPRSLYPEAL